MASLATPLRLDDLPIAQPRKSAVSDHRIVGFDGRDARARPFNLLRTSFARTLKESNHRLVGLTSAAPAAGKSFISMNLAASLARVADEPVFLVDLDLRRASLAEELGLEVDHGVNAFLEGNNQRLEEIGCRIEGTQLGLFPARRTTDASAELFAGEHFGHLIESFRNQTGGSFVLFDLPPVFANDDAMLILEKLDGYVLVVDAGKTTRRQVEDVASMLHPLACLGSILNRYHGGFGDSYGYGYYDDAYSKYFQQQ
jgi:Mrp family chromosome partitioning ATPase